MKQSLLKPSLNWLLLFVPASILAELLHASPVTIFIVAAIAIIPLAGWMGKSTEHLAHHAGPGVGGLLNATFGNAAELIIAFIALQNGQITIVKASLAGSIIGNILLVLGVSLVAGGLKFKTLVFNRTRAGVGSSMLLLASISLVVPAVYTYLLPAGESSAPRDLSFDISVVLILVYGLSLLFELHTHKKLLAPDESSDVSDEEHEAWSLWKSVGVLAVATGFVIWMSELLVGSVEHAAEALGLNMLFVGVFVVAIIGNAAEHSTAVLMAMKNKMDLSITIAIGSSLQIALFVAPVLVLAGAVMGKPMDLVFHPMEVIAVVISVAIANQVAQDGECNWLEGCQLLAVYVILGIVFYFLPEAIPQH